MEISEITSFLAFCTVASGLGGQLLSEKKIFNVCLVPDKLSFFKAGAIGTAAHCSAIGIVTFGLTFQRSEPGSDVKYLKKWGWIGFVPLIGIPYASGVALPTGITLVALSVLGGVAWTFCFP